METDGLRSSQTKQNDLCRLPRNERGFSVLLLSLIIAIAYSIIASALLANSQQHLKTQTIKGSEKQVFDNLALEIAMVLGEREACTRNLWAWGASGVQFSATEPMPIPSIKYTTPSGALGGTIVATNTDHGKVTVTELYFDHLEKLTEANVHLVDLVMKAVGHIESNRFMVTIPFYVETDLNGNIKSCFATTGVYPPTAEANPFLSIEDRLCELALKGSRYDSSSHSCIY